MKQCIKLSSCRVFLSRFNNHCRILCLALLMVFLVTSVVLLMIPNCSLFFPYPSWRNVSVYHILKMHLSGRPTHVTPLQMCKRMSKPYINESFFNEDLLKTYDAVPKKMDNLRPEDSWKKMFKPLLDKQSKIAIVSLYGVFQKALDDRGIGHMLMHGTAMGAWRHHGVTPWDDDIDLAVDMADWIVIRDVLSCIEGYTLDVGSNSKWAFYKNDGHVIKGSDKRWPFLDLFLYTYDDQYAWALNYVHLRNFVFRVEDLFPAKLVPFECFMAPVPRHLRKVLEDEYITPDMCTSHYMDHKEGVSNKKVISKPCSQLSDIYTMYY